MRAPGAITRVVLFAVAVTVAAAAAEALLYPLLSAAASAVGARLILYPWLGLAGVTAANAGGIRVDKMSWRDLGLGRDAASPRLFARAAVLGALAIGVPSLVLLAAGWLRAEPSAQGSWAAASLQSLAVLAPSAFAEEFMVHGYALRTLRGAFGWVPALAITSVVFGLLHLGNPGAGPLSVVMVMVAGFFLGSIVMTTGSLYAAGVMHLAWNWVLVAALHSPVSGIGLASPNYQIVDAGPDWATGGAWGPEGGLAAGLGMLAGTLYLFARRTRQRETEG
jgi:hypothetical protein